MNIKHIRFVFCVLLITSFRLMAEENSQNRPCMEVKKACETAGFAKGLRKEGKGLYKDCMQKLAAGEVVAGVSVSAEVIAACKEKRADKKTK